MRGLRVRPTTIKKRKTEGIAYVEVINNVDYVSKISPESAAVGLRNAEKRINHIYLKKLEKQIERESKK